MKLVKVQQMQIRTGARKQKPKKRRYPSPVLKQPPLAPPPLEYLNVSPELDMENSENQMESHAVLETSEQAENNSSSEEGSVITIAAASNSVTSNILPKMDKSLSLEKRLAKIAARKEKGTPPRYVKCYGCRQQLRNRKDEEPELDYRARERLITNTNNEPCLTCGRTFCDSCQVKHFD